MVVTVPTMNVLISSASSVHCSGLRSAEIAGFVDLVEKHVGS